MAKKGSSRCQSVQEMIKRSYRHLEVFVEECKSGMRVLISHPEKPDSKPLEVRGKDIGFLKRKTQELLTKHEF